MQVNLIHLGLLLSSGSLLCSDAPVLAENRENRELIEAIAQSWKEREARVQTLRCEWAGEFVTGEGSQTLYDRNWNEVYFPRQDVKVHQKRSLVIGEKGSMRYEVQGRQLCPDIHSFEPRLYVSLTNGRDSKSLYGGDLSGGNRFMPAGFVRHAPDLIDAEWQ